MKVYVYRLGCDAPETPGTLAPSWADTKQAQYMEGSEDELLDMACRFWHAKSGPGGEIVYMRHLAFAIWQAIFGTGDAF